MRFPKYLPLRLAGNTSCAQSARVLLSVPSEGENLDGINSSTKSVVVTDNHSLAYVFGPLDFKPRLAPLFCLNPK